MSGEFINPPEGDFSTPARYLLALLQQNGAHDPALELLGPTTLTDIVVFPKSEEIQGKKPEPQAVTILTGQTRHHRAVAVGHSALIYRVEQEERRLEVAERLMIDQVRLDAPNIYTRISRLASLRTHATLRLPSVSEIAQGQDPEPFRPFAAQLTESRNLNMGSGRIYSSGTIIGVDIHGAPTIAMNALRGIFE